MLWLLLRVVKSVVKSPIKQFKKFGKMVKHPIRYVKKVVKDTVTLKKVKDDYKKAKKFGKILKSITPKARKVERIILKARVVEGMTDLENLFLERKTSVTKQVSETNRKINELGKNMSKFSKKELEEFEKVMDEELKTLGIKSQEDLHRVINDAEFREELTKANSFDDYMDQWRENFYASDIEKMGFSSEEERDVIWKEIESQKTYEWFANNKLLK